MSFSINYPFNTPSNYSYDAGKIDVSGGKAGLVFEDQQINFQEDFDSSAGFTFDSAKAEFVGGQVQQKDQRPANSIVAATFTNSLDASWATDGFVSLTAGLNGTPVLSSGKVDCVGANGIYYSDALIGALSGDFVAKFKYTPHYTTSPSTNVNIFSISRAVTPIDDIQIFNSPSGNNLRITANGLTAVTFGTWEPTAEQEYTFEVICISNQVSVFVDNVQIGSAQTINPGQGTTSVRAWLGAYTGGYNVADGAFDDFILYSTASQTPTYTIPETAYAESNVTLPEFQHTGVGAITSFDSFTTIESGSPRYTIQIGQSGDYLYWDGAAWDVSDNSYAQANDAATFNANIDQLDVAGEIYGQFRITFPDTNTQAATSQLNALVTETKGYYQDNPTILPNNTFKSDGLLSFTETSTKTGSDEIKHILNKDNIDYYHDGVDWVVSDGTYAQSNTAAEIETNKSTFLTEGDGKTIQVKSFLHSDDGQSTPLLDAIDITYDFAGEDPTLNPITLYGFLRDLKAPLTSRELKVRPAWTYGDKSIITGDWVDADFVTTDTGYWEIDIFIEDVDPTYLEWRIEDRIIKTNFVNQPSVKFSELTILGERDFVC